MALLTLFNCRGHALVLVQYAEAQIYAPLMEIFLSALDRFHEN